MNRRALLPVGGGLLLLAVAFAFVVNSATGTSITEAAKTAPSPSQSASPTPPPPTTAPTTTGDIPASGCTSEVTYLAYDAPAGSNNFGPAVTADTTESTVEQAKAYFCVDPLGFATDLAFAKTGLQLDAAQAEDAASTYVKNPSQWKSDVDAFFATAKDFRLGNSSDRYYSMGQIPGSDKSVMPKLVRGEEPVEVGPVLSFEYNGVTRMLRLSCHFQPVVPKPFPHVPKEIVVVTSEVVVTTTPQVVVTTVTRPTTTSTTPRTTTTTTMTTRTTTSYTPPPPPRTTCPCIEKTQVSQPVPSPAPNTAGESVSTRPSPNPTGPKPSTSSQAPAPTPSGYDSGGGSGSAPGGSQCDSSSCQGGGQPSPTGPAPTPTQVAPLPPIGGDPGL